MNTSIMQASVDENNLNKDFLVHLRNFILDEVEADVVGLQNHVIGENHVQDANYKYRAWYKAKQEIHIGHNVIPKTNPGDYIIQATGDILVRAGKSISSKPGFHTKEGSKFHVFIKTPECDYFLELYNTKKEADFSLLFFYSVKRIYFLSLSSTSSKSTSVTSSSLFEVS